VHVDPRAGVLPYGLYNAAGLSYHAAGLHIVAQNAVAGCYAELRVLRLCVAGASAAVAVVPGAGAVVVVIARPGPGHGLRIIVLVIVVVPLRSRTFHGVGLGFLGVRK